MPAHSENFPWLNHQGHYNFFSDRMKTHTKVESSIPSKDGLYQLTLNNGNEISVFICDCYSFGVAEYYELIENYGKVDAIIINSNWCGYTAECKAHCLELRIGLFNISDFMAALNLENFWEYIIPTTFSIDL